MLFDGRWSARSARRSASRVGARRAGSPGAQTSSPAQGSSSPTLFGRTALRPHPGGAEVQSGGLMTPPFEPLMVGSGLGRETTMLNLHVPERRRSARSPRLIQFGIGWRWRTALNVGRDSARRARSVAVDAAAHRIARPRECARLPPLIGQHSSIYPAPRRAWG